MSELSVRCAGAADLPAVLALYAQPDFNAGRVVSLAESERLLAQFARYPDYGLYLAEKDGRAVGTFCLMVIDNIAHWGTPIAMVESVVVSETHQRAGIGKAMIRQAAKLAEAKGCYKLVLSSNVKSTHAHAFYESLGFERYGYSFRLDPKTDAERREAAA